MKRRFLVMLFLLSGCAPIGYTAKGFDCTPTWTAGVDLAYATTFLAGAIKEALDDEDCSVNTSLDAMECGFKSPWFLLTASAIFATSGSLGMESRCR